MSILVKRKFR